MKLAVKNLRKNYGSHEVLAIPEWEIGEGIYWVQGENGAGKSTLFRTLAGMLPFEGEVVLDKKFDLKRNPVAYRLRLNLGEAEPLYPGFPDARRPAEFRGRGQAQSSGADGEFG